MDEEKLEAWRHGNHLYEKDESIRHKGKTFVCAQSHYGIDDTEPGVGSFWSPFWTMLEVAEFPEADMSAKLFFTADGFSSMEQIDFDRLSELVESGECDVRFTLTYPKCKPIRISRMELIDFEETELGPVARFLVLRDLTDEEE